VVNINTIELLILSLRTCLYTLAISSTLSFSSYAEFTRVLLGAVKLELKLYLTVLAYLSKVVALLR
jgi:hypothetical protein